MTSFDVSALVPKWTLDEEGRVIAHRQADLWHREGRRIACDLCYRRCKLRDGQAGWCRARANRGGEMALVGHGQIVAAYRTTNGYDDDPFLTWKTGQPTLTFGGLRCTSRCSFCYWKTLTTGPDKIPWVDGERRPTEAWPWLGQRAMLHPTTAVRLVQAAGCRQISVHINEPMLTFEWSLDVAMVAKLAGLDVCLFTNGLSTVEAIERIAPFVDVAHVGIKGSGDPAFYSREMQAPGGMVAVRESLKAWQAAGVYVLVSDLVASPHLQTYPDAQEAQRQLYEWLVENMGEHTPLAIGGMARPVQQPAPFCCDTNEKLLEDGFTAWEFLGRAERAEEIAKAAGLAYVYQLAPITLICCHSCEKVIIGYRNRTHEHENYTTDGHCDHCGAKVPVVTMEN